MKKIALLSLVLAAGAAMAQEPGSNFDYTPGAYTRAAVQADFNAAVRDGTLAQTGEVGPSTVPQAAGQQRATANVRDEARQAARSYTTVGEV